MYMKGFNTKELIFRMLLYFSLHLSVTKKCIHESYIEDITGRWEDMNFIFKW